MVNYTLPDIGWPYPVVRCDQCRQHWCHPYPEVHFADDPWKPCSVNLEVVFTNDPDAIDRTIKLVAEPKHIGGQAVYTVVPVARHETEV